MTDTLAENRELVQEGEDLNMALEEFQTASASLARYGDITRQLLAGHEPVRSGTVALIRLGVSQTLTRVGSPALPTVSTESLTADSLGIALEAISDHLKKAWEAIKVALRKFWEWVKSFVGKLFGTNKDVEKKAKEVLLTIEDKSKEWGDTPPGADRPEYPYGDISNDVALGIMVDDKFPTDWARSIPTLFGQYLDWALKTTRTILTKEKALVALWESTLRETNRNWAPFDALLLASRKEYKALYEHAPGLPRNHRVQVTKSKFSDIDEVDNKTAYVATTVDSNFHGQKLGAKIRKQSMGDMVFTLEAVIKLMENEHDMKDLEKELKQYQDYVEERFYAVINERGYADDAELSEMSKDWQEAQKRIKFINGGEIKTALFIWESAFRSMYAYVRLVQRISAMHMQ